jgi:hypothetical protein
MKPRPQTAGPPGGPRPPAPPATGQPGEGLPDPTDPGPPIRVVLDDAPLGDLGNRRVDSRLLVAVLLRDGPVAQWLRDRAITRRDVEAAFPGAGWPLYPPLSWRHEPDPSNDASPIEARLDTMVMGNLGSSDADGRLLIAILLRNREVAAWLQSRGVDVDDVEAAFPGSRWDV